MAGTDAGVRFFDAVNQSYDAWIDAVRAANERGHRFSAALIEDAQRGQREFVELTSKWAEAPLDILGFYGSLMGAATKAQGRALDVSRQLFSEMGEAQKETREVARRVMTANRSAGEAAVEFGRGVFSRAGEAVQTAAQSAVPASLSDGRRMVREPVRAAERSSEPPTRTAERSGEPNNNSDS